MALDVKTDNCTLLELSRIEVPDELNSSFICESSNSDLFAITNGNKVRVLQLNASPSHLNKRLNLCNDYIEPPVFFPGKLQESVIGECASFDVDLCSLLSQPHRIQPVRNDLFPNIVQAKWSPKELVYNTLPLLAVLSSTGSTFVYAKEGIEWVLKQNMSAEITEFSEYDNQSKKLSENAYFTTSIAWGIYKKYNNLLCSELFMAQKDGSIIVWNISVDQAQDYTVCKRLLTVFMSDSRDVMSTRWIPLPKSSGCLAVGTVNGEVQLYKLVYCDSNVKFDGEKKSIYTEKDRLVVSYLEHSVCDNLIFVIFIKSVYVIVTVVNSCTLQVEYSENENLHSDISGCTWINSTQLALASKSNGIFILTINFDNKPQKILHLKRINVHLNDELITSLSLSSNKAIWIYTTVPSVMSCKKKRLRNCILFSWMEDFSFIMNALLSETFGVDNTKDILEIFRLLVIRKQINIKMWLHKLIPIYEDHLKLYIYIMKLSLNIKESNKVDMKLDYNAEELYESKIMKDNGEIISYTNVVLSNAAINRISNYSIKHKTSTLTEFESKGYQYCIAFLKKTAIENGQDWTTLFDTEVINIVNNIPEPNPWQCEWCGENFIGITCQLNHPLQCCCLTFQRIDNTDFLTCSCGLLARSELFLEMPTCPVCDQRFQKSYLFGLSDNAIS